MFLMDVKFSIPGRTSTMGSFRYPGRKPVLSGYLMGGLFTALLLMASSGTARAEQVEPLALILTWQQDPTTTMTIDWHTGPAGDTDPVLYYKADNESEWQSINAGQHPFPFSDRIIHRAELTGLVPGTLYRFRAGMHTREYSFETMPAELIRPLRFAIGGNVMYDKEWMEEMNNQVMNHNPDFIVWGGDMAYDMGREDLAHRWYDFLDVMRETLIGENGRVVPVIPAIGDHETEKQYIYKYDNFESTDEWRSSIAPYFFTLWAFPGQPGYNVLDFGDYLSLFILDSMHANETGGEQESWLRAQLAERQHIPHVFPVYHVGGWASVRGVENGPEQRAVYDHFYPAFEDFGIRASFEHHDYAYKRTPPMNNGEAVQPGEGVVYFGDGAWGSPVLEHVRLLEERRIRPKSERYGHIEIREDGIIDQISGIWYLDSFQSARHFTLVTIFDDMQHFHVIDQDGNTLDEYTEDDYDPSYIRDPEPHTGRWFTRLLVHEGTDWHIDPSLDEGKQPYIDNEAVFHSVPESYRGLEWIQTASEAVARNRDLATIDIPAPGTLYIAIDDRITTLPGWMDDWENTGDEIVIEDSGGHLQAMRIYRLQVQQGRIDLGPSAGSDYNMYFFFASYDLISISDLVVHDGRLWRKAVSFAAGRPVYTDEQLTASSVPGKYEGLEWIQTANSSRLYVNDPLASFRMNYNGQVYLALNSLYLSSPPAWLDDWNATGDQITAGLSYHIYEQSFHAGQTVELASQAASRGSNYVVLIDPEPHDTFAGQAETPASLYLHDNYPNPFNASTTFHLDLPDPGHVTLNIYDSIGRLVATLANEELPAGSHPFIFDAGGLSSGLYIYRLQYGHYNLSKTMMLLK
jgi:acid phosphatase type 7